MKAIVGMSGGVDSSVAAYLLKEQGYEVEGVSFILEERRLKPTNSASACCSVESLLDARKTARLIGINHTMVNLRNEFTENVIEPFIKAYMQGLTPNPGILCNLRIKFRHLLRIADEVGADRIATGHYARIRDGSLHKGVDVRKDQSYVLHVLRVEELRRLTLPLGEKTKDEVREIACRLRLPSAQRPESQEICFVGEKKYFKFLESVAKGSDGPVVEWETGGVLGRHKGIHAYTIGQRKRLGIATGKPLYVIAIDSARNTLYVGQREAAMVKEFAVDKVHWLHRSVLPVAKEGQRISSSFRATVKIRSTMKDEPATITVLDAEMVNVSFDEPQWAPAPGQSAVFYLGDVVIGGGVIRKQ
jgi:tRNA-specific 2-thiouridylase